MIFLVMQSTYDDVQIGLYNQKAAVDSLNIPKMIVSKYIVSSIDSLLGRNALTLDQVACIIANQGPGPFTSLRVVLATINGLAYAKKIPLIGVNGISTLYHEYKINNPTATVAVLLNAYNKDCYYYFDEDSKYIAQGCLPIEEILTRLAALDRGKINILGNGLHVFSKEIRTFFPQSLAMQGHIDYCSLDAIAREGIARYAAGTGMVEQIQPLYLKEVLYSSTHLK